MALIRPDQITVFTTVIGKTDALHEPKCETDVRFVCFTDNPIKSDRWEIVKIRKPRNPLRTSRLMKIESHLSVDTEYSLWVDANFSVMTDPVELIGRGDFVNFRHPDRTTITQEAEVIERLGYASKDALTKQLDEYHAAGFDIPQNPQMELSANGVIWRRHTWDVIALNKLWASEVKKHTLRDQMSVDYCAWKLGFKLNHWRGHYARHPHFMFKDGKHSIRRRITPGQRKRIMMAKKR